MLLFSLLNVSWIELEDSSTVFVNDGFNNDDDGNNVDDIDDDDDDDDGNDDDDDDVDIDDDEDDDGIKNPVLEKSDKVKNTPAAMPTMNNIC